jgi:hypothetical protein
MDEEEHVEGPQPESFYCEEVGREALVAVVAREGPPDARPAPALGSGRYPVAPEDRADGRAPNAVALLGELPVDPEVDPGRILLGEPEAKGLDLHGDAWPPSLATTERPWATDQVAVPPEHGFQREQHQALPPCRTSAMGVPPEHGDHDHESRLLPARWAHAAALGAMQDAELRARQEDLERLRPSVAASMHGEVEPAGEQRRRHAGDHQTGCSFLIAAEHIKRTGIPMEQPLVDSRSRSTTRVFALYGLVS